MLVPVLGTIAHEHAATVEPRGARRGVLTGIQLAVGLAVVQEAAQLADWWSILAGGIGVGLCAGPLLALLPEGACRMSRGLGAVVVLRGLVTCAFFGAEAYLPLTLTRLHGASPRTVGIPLTIASLGWSAASWWQGRRKRDQATSLQVGFVTLALGVALLVIVALPSASLWLAIPVWSIAGAGIGVVMPIVSGLVLELSDEASQGANSAAIQLADITGSVVGIASVALLVNGLGLHHLSTAVSIGDVMLAAVALLGALTARRISPAILTKSAS